MPEDVYKDYTFNVGIAINAMSLEEAREIVTEAVMDRIDGHLLAAQRAATVRWVIDSENQPPLSPADAAAEAAYAEFIAEARRP
ncbi:hypothetical protein [Mycobacteroides abscessus]|uniref:hypothetical protein n=1 Tax=Mycobacteroides abscessus TaxID=36809 RepID=UPI000C261AE3|nr:hypothetical protein [Mycobacteroides abscessus]